MMTQNALTSSFQWWRDHVEGLTQRGDSYMALCPAHNDVNPSLSITPTSNGTCKVHCFAGCEYKDVLQAISGETYEKPPTTGGITFKKRGKNHPTTPAVGPARDWWVQYTGVPAEEWESWGTRFDKDEIIFGWHDLVTEKVRKAGTKQFSWRPIGGSTPPIWPQLPDALPMRIMLVEGESDTGVLRHLGFPAYAMTKGVDGIKETSPVWFALHARGCQEVVFVLDYDEKSQAQVDTYVRAAKAVGLQTFVLRLNQIVDPLLGEKDPRDVWTRLHDPSLAQVFEQNIYAVGGVSKRRVDIMTFMRMPVEDAQWIVKDILLQQTVGMLVGAPKMGKTWLAHDIMISIATGRPFLNTFPVESQGAVVYISKEDPPYLLKDRFAKVLTAKGYGGSISRDLRKIQFPLSADVPLHIDLDRDFTFTDQNQVDSLLEYLYAIKTSYGYLGLVLFDPILRMIEGDTDIMNAVDVAKTIFRVSEQVRKEIGASVLLVHHRAKGNSEGKNSYGSVGFHAFSEGTQYLLGDEPDKEGWVHVKGEYKSAPETTWAYRFTNLKTAYEVEVQNGGRKPARKDVIRDLLMLALRDGSMYSVQDFVRSIGASGTVIEDVLDALQEQGQVTLMKDVTDTVKGGRPRNVWGIPR